MIAVLPLDLITQALRLANNLLEGDPTRTAQYVGWFWLTWPVWRSRLTAEQQKQVEDLVKSIRVEGASSVVVP